jgi:hypothetical protein
LTVLSAASDHGGKEHIVSSAPLGSTSIIKRLAAIAAAFGLVLVVAAPALAQDLHQGTNIPWNSTAVEQSCSSDELAQLQPGQVLWHFVGHFDTDVATMDATFSDSQFNKTDFQNTSTHAGQTGGWELDWDIITTEVTLVSASVTPDTTVDGFNLSHICAVPPVVTPEAPMSALLLLTAGISALGFFGLRMRRKATIA